MRGDTGGMFVIHDRALASVPRLSTTIERGMLVRHRARLYAVLGFDPMGVLSPRVYLEDAETREERTAFLSELFRGPGDRLVA